MADLAKKIAAINARIERMSAGSGGGSGSGSNSNSNNSASGISSRPASQATPRTLPVQSTSLLSNVSNSSGAHNGSDHGSEDNTTFRTGASISGSTKSGSTTTGSTAIAGSRSSTHKIKSSGRTLCPSDVSEDLDVEFLDHKRHHRFPQYGITVKASSTSTYLNVKFIDCTFDSYEGTLFDDCVLESVIFSKCHFRGATIVKLSAKGVNFTGCIFGQTHFENVTLAEDAAILNQSFAFERVVRRSTSDGGQPARASAIGEFEVIKNGKPLPSRQYGWAKDEDKKAVQGEGQLIEAPVYAGWENKVSKSAAAGDLMSFEESITFEEGEAQARSKAIQEKNGVILEAAPNWDRQFIRQSNDAVKLVNRDIEQPADAKVFAPTNFVTLDFGADPDTRKEEITDDCEIGKRQYYGTKKNKSKKFWAEKKAEQQQHRRRNIPGAPHFF